jgi:hypothetical protein
LPSASWFSGRFFLWFYRPHRLGSCFSVSSALPVPARARRPSHEDFVFLPQSWCFPSDLPAQFFFVGHHTGLRLICRPHRFREISFPASRISARRFWSELRFPRLTFIFAVSCNAALVFFGPENPAREWQERAGAFPFLLSSPRLHSPALIALTLRRSTAVSSGLSPIDRRHICFFALGLCPARRTLCPGQKSCSGFHLREKAADRNPALFFLQLASSAPSGPLLGGGESYSGRFSFLRFVLSSAAGLQVAATSFRSRS